MSYGDLSPYDLDLGSGRVHTHTHSRPARFLVLPWTRQCGVREAHLFLFLPFMNAVVFPI